MRDRRATFDRVLAPGPGRTALLAGDRPGRFPGHREALAVPPARVVSSKEVADRIAAR